MSRRFDPAIHIRSLSSGQPVAMYDDLGRRLSDIQGIGGARGLTAARVPIGLDQIIMWPGSSFPLHTHEGDHLLFVLAGNGGLHVDGVDYPLETGDSIYVPAEYPHGVLGPTEGPPMRILAFGVPHHPVDSTTRMHLVDERDQARAATGRETGSLW